MYGPKYSSTIPFMMSQRLGGIQYLHCIMSKHKNIHTQVTLSKLGGEGGGGLLDLNTCKMSSFAL